MCAITHLWCLKRTSLNSRRIYTLLSFTLYTQVVLDSALCKLAESSKIVAFHKKLAYDCHINTKGCRKDWYAPYMCLIHTSKCSFTPDDIATRQDALQTLAKMPFKTPEQIHQASLLLQVDALRTVLYPMWFVPYPQALFPCVGGLQGGSVSPAAVHVTAALVMLVLTVANALWGTQGRACGVSWRVSISASHTLHDASLCLHL